MNTAPQEVGIIVIGDEILSARRQDKHLPYAIKSLAKRGIDLSWAVFVGDNKTDLVEQLRTAAHKKALCFTFGGIGATLDDLTRQAVAETFAVSIVRHPAAVGAIEKQFGKSAYPNRILMADLPAGASLIPNPVNNVPGFSMNHIHCLPGFPEMAWPMFEWVLDTCYPSMNFEKPIQLSIIVHDTPESRLIPILNKASTLHPKAKFSSLPRFVGKSARQVELGVRGKARHAEPGMLALKQLLEEHNFVFSENGP